MLRTTLLAAACLALTACATQETQTAGATSGRDCFRNDDIFGYTIVDDHNVSVRAGARDYILTTTWNARDLDWSQAIALRSTQGWICTGNGLGVEIIGGRPPRRYPVSSITRAPEPAPATGS
jgi:hypothetical protein